jgi:hypothetical protein
MMNVGLHHRGVDPQLAAVLNAELHGGFDDEIVEALSVAGVNRLKPRLKASCLGTSSSETGASPPSNPLKPCSQPRA